MRSISQLYRETKGWIVQEITYRKRENAAVIESTCGVTGTMTKTKGLSGASMIYCT